MMMLRGFCHQVFIALLILIANAGQAQSTVPSCLSGDLESVISMKEKKIIINNSKHGDICARGYDFRHGVGNIYRGYLFLHPESLGLRAEYSVLFARFDVGDFVYVGAIPVSANRVSEGVYLDVVQEGGSLYSTTYKISPSSIVVGEEVLEYVLEGELCVDDRRKVFDLRIELKKGCRKVLEVKSINPVCVVRKNGLSILSAKRKCDPLVRHWFDK